MAKRTVEESSLTSVADAIRERAGTSEPLVFPEGFESAVGKLVDPVGYLAEICNKTVTEVCNPHITGKLYNDFQRNNTNLVKVDLPEVTELDSGCFNFCNNLREINFPKVSKMGSSCFEACHSITKWYFPSLETINGWGYLFASCGKVARAYFPKLTSITGSCTWGGNARLLTLVLGADTVCSISSTNVLDNTPIAGRTADTDGEMGYIYVPRSLVEEYKSASNWSDFASQIRAIEDYPEVLEGWE